MSEPTPIEPFTLGEGKIQPAASAGPIYRFLSPPQTSDELGRLGDYRVLRVLGAGGMGVVFEAEELALRRRVALKVLLPELAGSQDYRERFLREARAAAAIVSDHVVTIYFVSGGEVPYLAMPLLEGESLQTRIDRKPPLTLHESLEIARQTAIGLAAAHDRGLVHRDIKPANLWLEPVRNAEPSTPKDTSTARPERASGSLPSLPASFRVKILDFGVVQVPRTESNLTASGLVMGTPNYMSPEQAAGEGLDGRSDLFGLGCVLYQMLVGAMPFPGKSAMGVMLLLATKTPSRVDELNAAIPAEVGDLVAQLLRKNRDRRPASGREVAAAIEMLLARNFENIGLPACGGETVESFYIGETIAPSSPRTPSIGPAPTVAEDKPSSKLKRSRRHLLMGFVLVALSGAAIVLSVASLYTRSPVAAPEPILIGVLHSQTGTMAVSEGPLIEATVLAIEEVNAAGGVLGRPLRTVIVDGKSDPVEFQKAAERLIANDRVSAIFGGMTSPCRKAVKQVVERDNNLLFFPVSYEGLEQSPRIIYTGAAPNQKLLPGIDYLVKTHGKKRLFIVGSNLVSPRAATEVIRDHLKAQGTGAEIVETRFVPFGSSDFTEAVEAIVKAKPEAIVNILNGSSNFPFYRELRRRGIQSDTTPTLSISLTEHDLVGLDPKLVAGDYLAANYFQAIDREESHVFLAKVKDRFGDQRVVTDNMTASYFGVRLWAMAANKAGTADSPEVVRAIRGLTFEGPGGRVKIDTENQHAWRVWRVGHIRTDGTVEVVAQANDSVRADPFPATRSRRDWEQLLTNLYVEWGGHWQAPDRK